MPDFGSIFQSSFLLFKIGILIIIFLYIAFTVVILTQVNVMNKLVTEDKVSVFLRFLAIVHILLAVSLFLAAVVIL